MNIQVIAAASVPTPPSGERTLFVNADNGLLSWKYDDGTIHLFADGDAECCACIISKDYAEGILCALNKGLFSASEFQALINLGFNVNATETTDPTTGDTTCNVTIGPKTSAVIPPSSVAMVPDVTSFSHSTTQQYYKQFTPDNTSNQAVTWLSSNPAKATVSQTGLVTGVEAGTTTIYTYSQADPSKFASKNITLT